MLGQQGLQSERAEALAGFSSQEDLAVTVTLGCWLATIAVYIVQMQLRNGESRDQAHRRPFWQVTSTLESVGILLPTCSNTVSSCRHTTGVWEEFDPQPRFPKDQDSAAFEGTCC